MSVPAIRDNECPLCGCEAGTTIAETATAMIWSKLEEEWGASITEEVKSAHTLSPVVKLIECSACRLWYFSPARAGDALFYAQITSSSPDYYCENKWEFDYVRKFLQRSHKVLDVACGKGAFLRSVHGLVSDAVGVDTNPDAVRVGKEAGQTIHNQSIEAFARAHHDEFDLVSAFQVIEHLGSVMPFVQAAYQCVKPGGTLVLSVPNRNCRKGDDFGSLDYPPHHLSRWAEEQLMSVARRLNGRVLSIARQPLDRPQTIEALRRKELPAIVPFHFPGRGFLLKVLSRLALTFPLSLIWRGMNAGNRLGMFGASLIVTIQKS